MQDGKKMGGWKAKYEIGCLYRRHPTRKLNQKERNEGDDFGGGGARGDGDSEGILTGS